MKKLFFILFAVMSAATVFAVEKAATDPTNTGYLWNDGKDFYIDRTLLTKQECENLLKNTCPEAFRQYDKGNKLIKAGWSMFGIGLFVTATSWLPLTFENPHYHNYDYWTPEELDKYHTFNRNTEMASMVLSILGGAIAVSSIPVFCVGCSNRKKAADIYNYQCMQKEPDIRYSVTAGKNGLGLAINF